MFKGLKGLVLVILKLPWWFLKKARQVLKRLLESGNLGFRP